MCTFLTSLQSSESDIRQLSPGIPQLFHINKHSSVIFIYRNSFRDREFKFKVNRKLGLPNYKLCSSRNNLNNNNLNTNVNNQSPQCLTELQTPKDPSLTIQQNAFTMDSKLIVGRTHQLIINQYNEQYCTNCTYYLGLYSQYDIVQGSIFVMSANQPTFLEEGSSITTIVYRGEPDRYVIVDFSALVGVLYQVQGRVQVRVHLQGEVESEREGVEEQKQQQQKINSNSNNNNVVPIYLPSTQINNPNTTSPQKYHISITPLTNSPSALYTLIIMSRTQQIINIKDGVPYQMKYTLQLQHQISPTIKYHYKCESEGIVMVGTKDFQEIDMLMNCLDTADADNNNGKMKMNMMDIDKLLKTRKSYRMSNRLDIPLHPNTCTNIQLQITAKQPTLTYSLLISSTDIITLPLHRQLPGLLKYQSKLYQIYQISLSQKTDIRVTLKFCQGGDGRIMISKSKKNIYSQIYEQQVQIYEQTTYETLRYMGKPGLFYLKVQFKGRGGVMEYTVHVENVNGQSGYGQKGEMPLQIYGNDDTVEARVLRMGENGGTLFQIQFNRIGVVHEGVYKQQQYEIQYYVVESTNLKLLKKTENCNGQYFQEFVSHHEQIRETRVIVTQEYQQKQSTNEKEKDARESDILQAASSEQNQQQQQQEQQEYDEYDDQQQTQTSPKKFKQNNPSSSQKPKKNHRITFNYSTPTPYTFITIIPIVYNKQTHQFYHLYIPKYQQVQLKNGQLFSKITYFLSELISKVERIVDIHDSERTILFIFGVVFVGCMGTLVMGGIWMGANLCFRTRVVYVDVIGNQRRRNQEEMEGITGQQSEGEGEGEGEGQAGHTGTGMREETSEARIFQEQKIQQNQQKGEQKVQQIQNKHKKQQIQIQK